MRMLHIIPFAFQFLFSTSANSAANSCTNSTLQCRTQPGDPSFPTADQLAQLNSSIDGRLLKIVPSGQFCQSLPGGCPDEQWQDARFRGQIPGAMCEVNWEQDYASNPPSLCFRNTSQCGQGLVPIYGVNATSSTHIQAGVRFAQEHNLRVAVKSSGHDHLGRSTAKNSLLLWTRYFQNITYHDDFKVGGKGKGSAVTVGSGVALNTLYQDTKAHGKIYVGGHAATVAVAGGYIQGAGHSALSPKFGLAADNALEYEMVVANGSLVIVNEVSHPDLFWAIRGGGAGSWGVIISATLRTFPTFDAVTHTTFFIVNNSEQVGQLATIHAQHVFDWDEHRASQYWFVLSNSTGLLPPGIGPLGAVALTTFPNVSAATANASMAPFLDTTAAAGFVGFSMVNVTNVNDAMTITTDVEGGESIQGSRLIPADVYRHNATVIGETYKRLLDMNSTAIFAHLVAGGKVSENANIDSAINPKWRTAKIHLQLLGGWDDSTAPDLVEAIRQDMTNVKVPILEALAGGPESGAYSNEADVREPHFQTTFFGPNYGRLSAIKQRYDPDDLFLVQAGVGSEKWDTEGLCRVASV